MAKDANGRQQADNAPELIVEYVDSTGATLRIDRENGVIQGVKLLGPESRNGRVYPKEVIARASALYEGARVNVDHGEGDPSKARRYGERIGIIRNVRVEPGDGGLRGDFFANPKHALWEQLAWDAQHSPNAVGFSHNILGRTSRRDGKTVVEEITRVQSVDLVADPATTQGLFEAASHQEQEVATVERLTIDQWKADYPEFIKTIREDAVREHLDSEAVKAANAELTKLREQVDRYQAAEKLRDKQARIDALLTEAKLPAELLSETFRKQLTDAPDEPTIKSLIEDRAAIPKQIGNPPRSKEQRVAENGGAAPDIRDTTAFVEAITR
jgi:hypothetical protein